MPFGRCWRLFQKIPAYVQRCSIGLCPFTSRSRLFALTTDLPGPADGPLNIVQGNILASWSQNQNPFRMSEGDESDGNLECCTFELWMKQGTRRKLPSLDAAVSPRQGDDGYIIAHRFIMINRYHISHALSEVLKTLPKDPGLCSKMFNWSMPFHLAIQIVCTDNWSARTCWWTPEHCTRQYPCILIPESKPFQDEWRWRKWRKLGSVAHSNFGWYEVLVENCHLLMQLSCHVKVMMDTQ